jgi:hypothetical protein
MAGPVNAALFDLAPPHTANGVGTVSRVSGWGRPRPGRGGRHLTSNGDRSIRAHRDGAAARGRRHLVGAFGNIPGRLFLAIDADSARP